MTEPTVNICPKGHPTGRAFNGGYRCSRRSCGEERAAAAAASAALSPIAPQMPPEELAYIKRRSLARMPDAPMTDDESTEWAKSKLNQMLPEAVAIVQWDMRYGSDKVRSEAAQKVLAANGMDKREAAITRTTPQIIVNIGTGDTKAPWLERLKKESK